MNVPPNLASDESRSHALLTSSTDVSLIVSRVTAIDYVSPSVRQNWGFAPEGVVGHDLAEFFHPGDIAQVIQALERVVTEPGSVTKETARVRHSDGTWHMADLLICDRSTDPVITGSVITCRDLGNRKSIETRLRHDLAHDTVTGLPTRRHMLEWTRDAVARSQQSGSAMALISIDLDNFDRINDCFGHMAGDDVLRAVAQRLASVLDPEDLAARMGDDEFAVVVKRLPDTRAAEDLAGRILEKLHEPISVSGQDVFVTASLGVRVADADLGADSLLRDAELALRAAKGRGKAMFVVFDSAMQPGSRSRVILETELRRAVFAKAFVVHYQPIVDLATEEILGVEALLRWQHPTRGILPPIEFIPLAEETGLIVPLGQWVLAEACRQAVSWQALSPRRAAFTVSVNISARQLQRAGFVEEIESALRESGINPSCVKLEITETMMMTHEGALGRLHDLKKLGVRIAIDDFGTGYSSMAYLHRFPVDELKIDRVFVNRLGEPEGYAITHAVCSLAHSLNLALTGEGIETAEQQDFLLTLGCEFGQGYRFSRPIPAGSVTDLLQSSFDPTRSALTSTV